MRVVVRVEHAPDGIEGELLGLVLDALEGVLGVEEEEEEEDEAEEEEQEEEEAKGCEFFLSIFLSVGGGATERRKKSSHHGETVFGAVAPFPPNEQALFFPVAATSTVRSISKRPCVRRAA